MKFDIDLSVEKENVHVNIKTGHIETLPVHSLYINRRVQYLYAQLYQSVHPLSILKYLSHIHSHIYIVINIYNCCEKSYPSV